MNTDVIISFVLGLLLGGALVYHFHTQIALAVSKAEAAGKADLASIQAKVAALEAKPAPAPAPVAPPPAAPTT